MTQRHLSRRLLVGGTSAALLLGAVGFVPLLGSASAAGCPSWVDPKGDSLASFDGNQDPSGFFTDANLDIVASTFGTVGDSLVTTIVTDGLFENSSDAGDEFGFDFTVAGVELNLYADRTVVQGVSVLDAAAILGPNTEGLATATYDVAKKTVTIKAKLTEVAKAAEKAVAGQAVTALSSYTKDQVPMVPLGFGQPLVEYDRSATALTTSVGVECGTGGSAPAPAPTTAPTATPAPTTAPSSGSGSGVACPTWTDPAGDSGASPTGGDPTTLSSDDDLDIVSTTVSVLPDGGLVAAVKVVKLDPAGPLNTPGDEFLLKFNAATVASTVTLKRDAFNGTQSASVNGGTAVTGTVAYKPADNTVTGTFTAAQVKSSFGKALAGLKLDTFNTLAYGYSEAPTGNGLGFPLTDQSAAPATLVYTDAGGCGGSGGTPAPTTSTSPTASPAPTTPAPVADGLFALPRKGCVTFTDPGEDADPTGTGMDPQPQLDVLQVNLKSPADSLQVLTKLADITVGSDPWWIGQTWATTLKVGGKTVVVTLDGADAVTATVNGTANTDLKPTVTKDAKNSLLVVTLPKTNLEKVLGAPLAAGAAITDTAIATAVEGPLVGSQAADDATGTKPEEKTYAYGDNTCFKPPAGKLAVDVDPSGQYGDTSVLFATLNDVDGAPVVGATVKAALTGGTAVSAATDADGIAELRLPIKVTAGSKVITFTFAGTDVVGATSATAPFKVVAEKSVLKVVAVKGGATATLRDDDKHPIVGQRVTFTMGKKKVVVKTNSKGVAAIGKLAKGTAIKVSFAAVAGKYLAAPAVTVKAK